VSEARGFQHRRVRCEEEITWLVEETEINTIVSKLPGNQNLAAYRQAGIATNSVPVGSPVDEEEVKRFFSTLDQAWLADRLWARRLSDRCWSICLKASAHLDRLNKLSPPVRLTKRSFACS